MEGREWCDKARDTPNGSKQERKRSRRRHGEKYVVLVLVMLAPFWYFVASDTWNLTSLRQVKRRITFSQFMLNALYLGTGIDKFSPSTFC
jgi:hypothetical protein